MKWEVRLTCLCSLLDASNETFLLHLHAAWLPSLALEVVLGLGHAGLNSHAASNDQKDLQRVCSHLVHVLAVAFACSSAVNHLPLQLILS